MTWAVEVYATHKKVRIIRQLLSRDKEEVMAENNVRNCLLYTSDAADE